MSFLSRLLGRARRSRGGEAREPIPRARIAGPAPPLESPEPAPPADPLVAASYTVAGIEPLGGEHPQVRVAYSGTWDGPLFITVTATPGGGEVSIADPGDDFRPRMMAVLAGEPAAPASTCSETRCALPPPAIAPVRALLAGDSVWTLTDGALRGNDGHWITVEAFSPRRGHASARDWCPDPASPLARAAAITLRAAAVAEPELESWHWVQRLQRAD